MTSVVLAPALWRHYIMNGDGSYLTPKDREACDAWLATNEVIDADQVHVFSNWNGVAQELIPYTVKEPK